MMRNQKGGFPVGRDGEGALGDFQGMEMTSISQPGSWLQGVCTYPKKPTELSVPLSFIDFGVYELYVNTN